MVINCCLFIHVVMVLCVYMCWEVLDLHGNTGNYINQLCYKSTHIFKNNTIQPIVFNYTYR